MNQNLINAVIAQLGYDEIDAECRDVLREVSRHGADAGFGGFIYYTETRAFFESNRASIVELVKQYADDFGQDSISFVAGFNCIDDDIETRDEIGRAIYGKLEGGDTLVANALAWFALEEVARHITE